MSSLQKFVVSIFLFISFGYLGAAIKCPTTEYFLIGNKCLKPYPNDVATWEEAVVMCNDTNVEGAHLIYIDNCADMPSIAISLSLAVPSSKKYWIGASKNGDTWTWLDGTPVKMGTPYWGTSSPGWVEEPNSGVNLNCASINQDDQFYIHNENCYDELNVLCEVDPVTTLETNNEVSKNVNKKGKGFTQCPTDFRLISGSCFSFHYDAQDATTYSEAQTLCNNSQASLAVLDDCNLFGDVVTFIKNNPAYDLPPKASYWLGLTDQTTEGSWYWDNKNEDRLDIGPPFWGSVNGVAEPNGGTDQNCGLLYADNHYYFHDGECYKKAHPLCQLNEV